MGKRAGLGSVVSIRYRGGVQGEEPVDENLGDSPLTVMIGDMKLPRGVEEALIGMEEGEQKTVDIAPELGYGEYQEGLAQWYPRLMLKDGYELEHNDVLFWTNPQDGQKQPAWVVETTQDQVKIDFNHPFAGKTLEYWLELVEVR